MTLASLVCGTLLALQPPTTITVRAELTNDPGGGGPAAWTWVRESVLPRLDTSFEGDPMAALTIEVVDDGRDVSWTVRPHQATGNDEDHYLAFEVFSDGVELASGTCDHIGRTRARIRRGVETPARVTRMVAGITRGITVDPIVLDLGAMLSNIAPAVAHDDLPSEALTIGGYECGTVEAFAQATDADLLLIGCSSGGLLLPAVLAQIAERRANRDTTLPVDAWLALSASSDQRAEAVRQLALLDDPQAREILQRLSRGRTEVAALAGLGIARGTTVPSQPKARRTSQLPLALITVLTAVALAGTFVMKRRR